MGVHNVNITNQYECCHRSKLKLSRQFWQKKILARRNLQSNGPKKRKGKDMFAARMQSYTESWAELVSTHLYQLPVLPTEQLNEPGLPESTGTVSRSDRQEPIQQATHGWKERWGDHTLPGQSGGKGCVTRKLCWYSFRLTHYWKQA